MPPAFSSLRQARAFALLLLVMLLSPWLAGRSGLPPREQIYLSIPWRTGGFPYIYKQIFEEKGDIDIVFLGSSHMYHDIDTPYVQKQLSEKLGRPAIVRSLCWNNAGFDADYFIARDLLDHRKVRLLVFYDDRWGADQPHTSSWRWIRFGDDSPDLAGLPLNFRIAYYYGSILAMPRNLLNKLRPNLAADTPPELFYLDRPHELFPPDHLGATAAPIGYRDRPDLFKPYSPQTPASPSDVYLYSPETRDKFQFSEASAETLQTYFARKFLSIAQTHSTRLVCVNLPPISEFRAKTIFEGRLWIDSFSTQAPLMGIVPARLFEGLDYEDVRKLYQDPWHMNENGQAYFTRLITPKLIQLYEQANP